MSLSDSRQECSFGASCYRRNPHHFKEFKHQHLSDLLDKHPDLHLPSDSNEQIKQQLKIYSDIERGFNSEKRNPINSKDFLNRVVSSIEIADTAAENVNISPQMGMKRQRSSSVSEEEVERKSKYLNTEIVKDETVKISNVQKKLKAASPFNFFLTKVRECAESHKALDSLYMTDLLHPSLGKLKSTLQINFMVDLEWLSMNYEVAKVDELPLVILYGAENPELSSSSLSSNIRAIRVKPKYPYGTHHTKMMILSYEDGSVRVVVHTANLVPDDWENRTQGLWVSDLCPKLTDKDSSGESVTKFKASLLRYLQYYEVSALQQFIMSIQNCDMSHIKTAFIASVPGSHKDGSMCLWGHRAMAKLLRQNVPSSVGNLPLTIQCSSIGSLGMTPEVWLEHELGTSLSSTQNRSLSRPRVCVMYPSHNDVLGSYDGPLGGGCLPYSSQTASKQPWLIDHLVHWRAEASYRSRAMPHIKTYTRANPEDKKIAFFALTSANLSKAAWGSVNKAGNSCLIMSYEAGVVWLPKFFTGDDMFETVSFRERKAESCTFPLHYDLPMKRYEDGERPWLYDYLLK